MAFTPATTQATAPEASTVQNAPTTGKKHLVGPAVSLLAALLGICLLLYPVVSTRLHNAEQQRIAEGYSVSVSKQDTSKIDASLRAADEYNEELASGAILDPFIEDARPDTPQYQNYLSRLNLDEVMSQVTVPTADIKLPIYHGTTDDVLKKGVGHLFGSALPVGGESTHTVLTGHTGLSTATLFDNLNKVQKGDAIYLNTLGRKLKYVVTSVDVVIPSDTEKLKKVPGKDLITLITCTPYGVNSHRLLVTGERVAEDPVKITKEAEVTKDLNPWEWWMIGLIAAAVASVLLVSVFVWRLLVLMRRDDDDDDPANTVNLVS